MNARPQRSALAGTTNSRRRLRAHKSDGAVCPLLTRLDARSCDRDAFASLNMVSCALCALGGGRTCAGAPLPGPVQTLRVRKTSFFVWTIITKQTVSAGKRHEKSDCSRVVDRNPMSRKNAPVDTFKDKSQNSVFCDVRCGFDVT